MIKVEKYKAFYGIMRITPRTKNIPALEVESDWLYNPDNDCWLGNGASYPAQLCTVIFDSAEKQVAKKLIYEHRYYGIGMCPNCGKIFKEKGARYCDWCGQKLDRSEIK
jgi:hypothetical protein